MSDNGATYTRPDFRMLPAVTPESTAFWTGGEHGELRIYRCQSCGHFFHPPAPACYRCRSTQVGPDVASGRAKVAAYTVTDHQWMQGYPPPYMIALVELDDEPDVRLTTNLIECAFDAAYVGMPVEVLFEHWEDVWIPLFRPITGASQ